VVKTNQTIAGARMTISMNMVTEETLEECRRHVDECAALLERTSVPEYREAIIAMTKAWMKIAERAKINASS
jgi:Na+/H+-translocating membrane pyrophosphatase